MELVLRLDCKVRVLHQSAVLAEGRLDRVTTKPRLTEVYLVRAHA